MLLGNDIAGVNGPLAAANALARGAGFVFVKATEGLGWNDPLHDQFVAQIRRAGKKVGHYHYAWPENDPVAEARHFLAVAKPLPGDALMLDFERNESPTSWGRRAAYAVVFLATVKAATKASPFLYLNGSWIDGLRWGATPAQWATLTTYPLAYAHYSGTPGVVDFRAFEWPTWTMHQYTDVGLDGDAFNGDLTVWAKLAVPQPAPVAKVAVGVVAAVVAAAGGVLAVHAPAPAPVPRPVVRPVTTPLVCPAPKPAPPKVAPKPAPAPVFYTVRFGDTLTSIATRYHTTVAALAATNHLANPNAIRAGQPLRVQ